MSHTSPAESRPFPTRIVYDRAAERLRIVVDAFPADIDDVTVAAGSSRLRIRIERAGDVYDRTITPPNPRLAFTDEREATYNNGVLSVGVGTARRSPVRGGSALLQSGR